jgi:hypothetical protein
VKPVCARAARRLISIAAHNVTLDRCRFVPVG